MVSIENTRYVRQVDQPVCAHVTRATCGHLVGIDVVSLAVGSESQTSGHRHHTRSPQRLDELYVYSSQFAHEAQACRLRQRLSKKASRITARHAYGGLAGC